MNNKLRDIINDYLKDDYADIEDLDEDLMDDSFDEDFDEEEEIPDMSVGFWETDTALIKSTDNYGKVRYTYEGNKTYSLPYVGYAKSINRISKGTICRVSLTRVFKGKYWLQLSGWY